MGRLTLHNPISAYSNKKTYRVNIGLTSFRLECQGGEIWIFGELINRLGELEDMEEELRRRNRE